MMINGIVTDPSGRPVAGAVVSVTAAPVPVPDIAALTSEDGRFSITVPVSGDYRILVRGDSGVVEIEAAVGESAVEVMIELSD